MKERIAIVGTGLTEFGELWDRSWIELVEQAGLEALEDSKILKEDVDEYFIGTMSPGQFQGQEHIAAKIKEDVFDGSKKLDISGCRIEGACASGGMALKQAYNSILAGLYKNEEKVVMVGGFEKMKDKGRDETSRILGSAADYEREVMQGATFPALYALIADRYLNESEAEEDDLHLVSVKNHINASKNPKAQYQKEISLDNCRESPLVADPLRLFDCSPISDGAASLLLMPESKAEGSDYVILDSIALAQDTLTLESRKNLTTFETTVAASQKAYKEAGIRPEDVDVAEVHDCFSIAELIALEDLGFCGKYEAYKTIRDMELQEPPIPYKLSGKDLYVNPSGGLKARGHPVGATGIAQAVEVVDQLRGRAGQRQVDCNLGIVENVGGTGGTSVVSVYKSSDYE